MSLIFFLKVVKDVSYPQTISRRFVSVCRTYTFTCCSNFALSSCGFVCPIQHSMRRHDEMSLLGDMNTAFQFVATLLQFFSFVHEKIRCEHYPIADDINLSTLKDARRNAAKNIFLALKLQCMACIWSPLKPGNNIIFWRKYVDHFAFSFVTPLQT